MSERRDVDRTIDRNIDREADRSWDLRPFTDWLHASLLRREWRPPDLAREMGVHRSQVNTWLRGLKRPRPPSAMKLADVFAEDEAYVLYLTGNGPRPATRKNNEREIDRLVNLMRTVVRDEMQIRTIRRILEGWHDDARKERQGAREALHLESAD